MSCEFCDGREKMEILHQDDDVIIAVRDVVMTPGQITVFPKNHYTIMEMVPPSILEKCAVLANKVGIAVFESLGAQGTNIIIHNGLGAGQKVPHFAVEVIPRQETDKLQFTWPAKPLSEDEMEMLQTQLSGAEISLKAEPKEKKQEEKKPAQKEGDNYLLKSLRRLP